MKNHMVKLNSEVKKLWVERLRSGVDIQGKSCLHSVNENGQSQMCCLGVLSDIYINSTSNTSNLKWEFSKINSQYAILSERTVPLREIGDWAGFPSGDWGVVKVSLELIKEYSLNGFAFKDDYYQLAYLNDAGMPFEVIADLIEEQL